jgi:predicted dehydrogenase
VRRTRIAVIGCGHMGSLHAKKLVTLPQVELVAVVDPDPQARFRLAEACRAAPLADFRSLFLDRLEAAIVAVPTHQHARVAAEFLARGIHVLVEKPLADCQEAAAELAFLAERKGVILQVGHIERFNPAFVFAAERIEHPVGITTVRFGRLLSRNVTSDVVFDLLIHDLDLATYLAKGLPIQMQAAGWSLAGESLDYVQAFLLFANGAQAVCTASRIHSQPLRRMDVFDQKWFFQLDLGARTATAIRRRETEDLPEGPTCSRESSRARLLQMWTPSSEVKNELSIPREEVSFPDADPLTAELEDFLGAIRYGSSPRVDAHQGLLAVRLAEEIRDLILDQLHGGQPVGGVQSLPRESRLPLAGPHFGTLAKPPVPESPVRRSPETF